MNFVPEVITRTIARNSLLVGKVSPDILFVAGVVGMVGSTVLACRATLKMESIVDDAKSKLDVVKASEEDHAKDISLVYVQTTAKVAKAYAPAVIVGVISVAALTRSHSILTNRNAALAAAYTALDAGFNQYRGRVIDKYGEDADRDFRYGTERVQIGEGSKKKTVTRVGPGVPSIYARFFDPTSANWNREPEYNLIFLQCQQQYANDRLHAYGHVFLNEVYDMLGIPRSQAGAVVGWLLSRDGDTDNFVNFGVFDGRDHVARDFVNGREGSILLDFNVDGVIYDKI